MPFDVRVRNFQSVEDATIRVDGLTVLTGTNNTGKSAFFRALRGVFTNTRGHSFVRHGAPHCTVDVTFDDGSVQWEKGANGINQYKVGPLHLKKVGLGPPAEVSAFGIRAVKVGEEQIWPQIAPQLSGVQFLLDQPAPVLAEALADVERVNQINRALRASEGDRKQARSDLRANEELLQALQVQVQRFADLDQDLTLLAEIEREHVELTRLQQQIHELEALRQRLQASRAVLQALSGIEKVELPSDEDVGQLRRLHQALVALAELSQRLTKARENARRHEDGGRLERVKQELLEAQEPLRELEQTAGQVRLLEGQKTKLRQLRDEMDRAGREIAGSQAEHQKAQESVRTALGAFSECPTCGGKFR